MPCPRHGLTLAIIIEADAMSQTCPYTSSHIFVPKPCPRHGLTLTHLVADACPRHVLHSRLNADSMSQTWSYTGSHNVVLHWLSSINVDAISQTGLTLTHVKSMPCPRQFLHWLAHLEVDACPKHVLHWLS
ncbi:Dihydroxy-acid dehydratase [Gossypium arboreum]|uniref:Dihydroxy-acid dehydratase n=1 Tax=Gossypium arboreum TaxID=29729 RepID=A0A0B0N0Y3_GOSAR|nr:Dihydroxy-acid dehydratase [Gossypium arboreum]